MEHSEIKGFTDQNDTNKSFINRNKESEERLLRITDELRQRPEYDQRFISTAVTYFQIGFMLLNRSIFQPQRIELPEDADPLPPMPPIYVGEVYRNTDSNDPEGNKGQPLIASGPHWYVKSDWDNYQRRVNGEPELPLIPTPAEDQTSSSD